MRPLSHFFGIVAANCVTRRGTWPQQGPYKNNENREDGDK